MWVSQVQSPSRSYSKPTSLPLLSPYFGPQHCQITQLKSRTILHPGLLSPHAHAQSSFKELPLLFLTEQVFLLVGKVWLNHNIDTQQWGERGGQRAGKTCLNFSCNKIWILFHNINTFISDIFFCKHFFNEFGFTLYSKFLGVFYHQTTYHVNFFSWKTWNAQKHWFPFKFFCDPLVSKKYLND